MSRCQRARAGRPWLAEGEHQLLSSRGPRETMVSSSSGAGRCNFSASSGTPSSHKSSSKVQHLG